MYPTKGLASKFNLERNREIDCHCPTLKRITQTCGTKHPVHLDSVCVSSLKHH